MITMIFHYLLRGFLGFDNMDGPATGRTVLPITYAKWKNPALLTKKTNSQF